MAEAWLIGTAVNATFMQGAGLADLQVTLILIAAVLSARAVIAWGQEWVSRRCSAAVKSELRMKLLRSAASIGPGQERASSGEIVALATRGLDSLDAYFARYLPQMVLAMIVPVVVIVALATADIVAAVTVAVTVPLIPVFMALIGMYTERRRKRRWNALTRLSSHFLDVVAGLPTLRIFGRGVAQVARLRTVTDEYRRETMATLRAAFLSAFALELAATISMALVAVGVGLALVDGAIDLRTGLFVLVLAPEAYLPLRQLGANFHASEEGLAAARSALAIIEGKGSAGAGGIAGAGPNEGVRLPDLAAARIEVEGVSVSQPGRALQAPCEASLVLRGGEVTGVAGPSGAGKSSLVDVILGLRPADSGRVAIVAADGRRVDLDEIDAAEWHRHVAWAPQHPYLFPGTVADNIRLAAPNATDDEVARALAGVGLDQLDPEQRLGEAGSGVSSGQRRRIGVARALLRGGRVLILDEPTAGLDAESEAKVLASIRAAARTDGRAVLLVGHRPAALAIADTVVTIASRSEQAS